MSPKKKKHRLVAESPAYKNEVLRNAISNKDLGLVKSLIENGECSATEAFVKEGATPLTMAIEAGDTPLVEYLLGHDLSPNAMRLAITHYRIDYVGMMLDRGFDINTPLPSTLVYKSNFSSQMQTKNLSDTPLITALNVGVGYYNPYYVSYSLSTKVHEITAGHTLAHQKKETIMFLIDKGANVNIPGQEYGRTALHIACERDWLSVVNKLIENGANLNETDNRGYTALHIAAVNNRLDIFRLLIDKGIDVRSTTTERTALHFASRHKLSDMHRILVAKGAPINALDERGRTPLYWAIKNGHIDVAMFLLSNHAEASATTLEPRENKTPFDRTPLHLACQKELSLDLIKALVANGAPLNTMDSEGHTPLSWAVANKNVSLARCLIQLGASADHASKYSKSPLHLACMYNLPEVAQALIDEGAQLNTRDRQGCTALHYAVNAMADRRRKIAMMLIANGADGSITDKKKMTPLQRLRLSTRISTKYTLRLAKALEGTQRGASVRRLDRATVTYAKAGDAGHDLLSQYLDAKEASLDLLNADKEEETDGEEDDNASDGDDESEDNEENDEIDSDDEDLYDEDRSDSSGDSYRPHRYPHVDPYDDEPIEDEGSDESSRC